MTLGEVLTAVGYISATLAAVVTFVRGYQRVRDDLDHIVDDVRGIGTKIDRLSGLPQRLDALERNETEIWKAIDGLRIELKELMKQVSENRGRIQTIGVAGGGGGAK